MGTATVKETARENPAADPATWAKKRPAPAGLFLFVARGTIDVAVQQRAQGAMRYFYQLTFT